MNMLEKLPELDLDAPAFYGADGRNVRVGIDPNLRHVRKAAKRRHLDATRLANASKHLDPLPAAGESLHCIMSGNFDGWQIVPAILDLARPANCTELNIATLGFNERNAGELIALLDAGRVGACTFICSHFYKTNEGQVFDRLHADLTSRGHRCLAMRCHAKLLLFEFDDGRCFVNESSANLRSCRNIEQFVLTHDRPLLEFHRGWMMGLFGRAAA